MPVPDPTIGVIVVVGLDSGPVPTALTAATVNV
jgi:hypothetical protein